MSHEQRAVERKLRRMQGMSAEAQKRLAEFNQTQVYRGVCRKCGAKWVGLLEKKPAKCEECGLG